MNQQKYRNLPMFYRNLAIHHTSIESHLSARSGVASLTRRLRFMDSREKMWVKDSPDGPGLGVAYDWDFVEKHELGRREIRRSNGTYSYGI